MFGITDYSKPIIDYSNFDLAQLGQAAGFGGAMVLIGMLTIFTVLCLLWACLVVFKIVFHDLPEKRTKKLADKTVDLIEAVPVAENVASQDDEIVAVIAAAIAMAESESSGIKFKVVSFKRT